MDTLTNLFKLIQLTRSQPMYGYALNRVPKTELGDLAQHHYLVTFIAWQLARQANDAGADINVERVLEIAMIHDLGEIFGGDISYYYARVNKKARKAAKQFEGENLQFLSNYFAKPRVLKELVKEMTDKKTDASLIAKMADYIECIHYKLHSNMLSKYDIPSNSQEIIGYAQKIKDPIARKELTAFGRTWAKEVGKGDVLDLIWSKKK